MKKTLLISLPFMYSIVLLAQSPTINTIAGNGTSSCSSTACFGDGGPAVSAALVAQIECIAVDFSGNVFVADQTIRKIDGSTGIIDLYAGNTAGGGFSGDGGPANVARVNIPTAVAVDAQGNLYFSDSGTGRIRKVNAGGGYISTIAGISALGFSGDGGQATAAKINRPLGLAKGLKGLYISDTYNYRIRKIQGGIITTIAGTGTSGYSGDGGPATSAQISTPSSLAVDASDNVYFIDANNRVIRRIDATTGIVTTIAGGGSSFADGVPALSARLDISLGSGIVLDASRNIYFSNSLTGQIRKIDGSTNIITTIAGTGTSGFSGDGGPAISAELKGPTWLAIDGSSNLYVVDQGNQRLRKIDGLSTGLKDFTANKSVSVYPIPANDILHIEGTDFTKYAITNLIGQALQQGEIENNSISTVNLARGVYVLHLTDNKSGNAVVKFVKE